MLKKIIAVMLAAVFAVMLAGCSNEYVMSDEDLALQRSLEGYWMASASTGYNTYDENGNVTVLVVVEFTDDFKYFLHECDLASGFIATYDPVSYTFEDKKFKVDVNGAYSYAAVSVSEDGQTMYWINDNLTDMYERLSEDDAKALGIPEYDREKWSTERAETENSEGGEDASEENSAE